MKIQYKDQTFQSDASKAVVEVFSGQPYASNSYIMDAGNVMHGLEFTGWNNNPVVQELNDRKILEKINEIQRKNQLKPDDHLFGRYNLTIEMETGVGKTFTYIKTMYELNQAYGWCKFIIVVPSIAIREGVYKTFQTTEDYFALKYNKKIRYFIYNSTRLTDIEHFASDSSINVMIINSQAFNATGKDARRIYMKLDEFRSRRPIDVIAKTNPILIIDEPQSVEGEKTRERLKEFNPLMTLRYSATHRENYNMIYRLDAMEAYNKRLVKKIRVTGITQNGTSSTDSYIYLAGINLSSGNPTATIEFNFNTATGTKKITRTVNEGYNLYDNSNGREEYKNNFIVTRIDGRDNSIEFMNGIKLFAGEVTGKENEDNIRAIQIRETIKAHLEHERQLFYKGIKVLSLFFIDEVANYRVYGNGSEYSNGKYADMFEEQYAEAVEEAKKELALYPEYEEYIRADENLTNAKQELQEIRKQLNEKLHQEVDNVKDEDKIALTISEKLCIAMDKIKSVVNHLTYKQIEDRANEYYREMTKNNPALSGDIKVDIKKSDIYTVDEDGNRIQNINQANRISIQLAIIAGILTIASEQFSVQYPFVTDAPVSNLGGDNKLNTIKTIINAFEQSIIILKDDAESTSEDDDAIRELIKSSPDVGTAYELKISKADNITEQYTTVEKIK